ncbi:MAG TPA: hypothetical protein VK809_05875, partial [Bacteroidia bacterium]|nr:hypothetical protein [Bacteroidia bacterium]
MNVIRNIILLSSLSLIICCNSNKSTDSQKVTAKAAFVVFDTEEELAKSFLNSFAQHDTGMMKYLITNEAITNAVTIVAKENPDTSTTLASQIDRAKKELTNKIIPAYKAALKGLREMLTNDN